MVLNRLIYSLSIISFFILGGCSNSVQELPSDQGSTFLVSQISATSELVPNSVIPAIKEANFIHFKVCTKDVAVQAPLVGEKFEIQFPDERKSLVTDGEGCLVWSQAIIFPWFSKETWIKQDIAIKATGNHLGQLSIPVFINPWKEGTSGVLDSRYQHPSAQVSLYSELISGSDQLAKEAKSPFNLSNIVWKVLRRRGRGDQTILEWHLEATPVFERTNLDGQTKRESLSSGRGNLKIQLAGDDINGRQSFISSQIEKSISWQGGTIKIDGELVVATANLPTMGELTNLKIELALPGSLPKLAGSLLLRGVEQSSSTELIENTIETEANNENESSNPRQEDVIGDLNISSIRLISDNDDLEGYVLDENLQLSLTKSYRIEFNPSVILPGADIMGDEPTTLTHGKLAVKAYLYAPKVSGVNFENPDLSQFTLLTQQSYNVDIRPDGLVSKLVKFPMAIANTPLLRMKNLLLLEITPKDGAIGINEGIFSGEVYPLGNTNQVTAFKQSNNNSIYSSLAAAQGVDTRGLQSKTQDAISFFENTVKKEAIKKGFNFKRSSLSQVSSIPATSKIKAIIGRRAENFSMSDFRTLMSTRAKPKDSLAKLCSQFFTLPTVKREFNWGTYSNVLEGGDDWKKCIENPQTYLQVTPSDHLVEFLKKDIIGDIVVTRPQFISQSKGEIFRGVGYFASFGDRSSEGSGERTGRTIESNVGFSLAIPFITKAGIGDFHSYSTYRAKEIAQMQASFERQYTQQKDIELEYNKITLEFLARMRRCLTASVEMAKKTLVICEDNDRLTRTQESWYFIGDTRLNKIGVITNATVESDAEMAQIIRGEAAFKNIWGEFRDEDRALVLEKLDGDRQGILQSPITDQLKQDQSPVGVGFPGLITPY